MFSQIYKSLKKGYSISFLDEKPSVITDDYDPPKPDLNDPDIEQVFGNHIEYKKRFKTYLFHDSFDLIALMNFPCVHIIVENMCSTIWSSLMVVLEEPSTQEWYVIRKGEMSFHGGTGLVKTKDLIYYCIENKIEISTWFLDYHLSNKLSQGCTTWPVIKDCCIPLLSYIDFPLTKEKYLKSITLPDWV